MAKKVMGKKDIVESIAKRTRFSKKDSEMALNAFVETVRENLKKGYTVRLIPFGTFETRHRKARTGRNPRTGAKIKISARQVPAFRPGKGLKDAVSK